MSGMSDAERMAHALGKPERRGREWACLCPAHRDKAPSLNITQKNGTLLFRCRAGCTQDAVLSALRSRGLWSDAPQPRPKPKPAGGNGHEEWFPIVPAPADAAPPPASKLRCDMLHVYRDRDGNLLGYIRRHEAKKNAAGEETKRKDFYPLHWGMLTDKHGKATTGWHARGLSEPKPLYGMEKLKDAPPSIIVVMHEGEKKADAGQDLFNNGMAHLSWMGGAAADRKADIEAAADYDAILWPDADQPGNEAMARIAQRLPKATRIVDTTGLPEGYDCWDLREDVKAGRVPDAEAWLKERLRNLEPTGNSIPVDKQKPPRQRTLNVLSLVTHINTKPAWNGVLRFNELTENYEICGPFPPQDGPKEPLRAFRDPQDTLLTAMYFQANGFPKAGTRICFDAIAAAAHEHAYHPVRDYLNAVALKWDGTERVEKLFWHYFNAEVPEEEAELYRHLDYLQHISVGFMVGAVARVMEPGCKHDHVPVVVGRERLLKSTAIRALCHDAAWFSDDISPNLIERDTKESLAGKWLIELAEVPHIRRETERVKAFFSRCVDRYRSAYGRANQDHPRQCAFIGTSNDLEFVDVTGNRRFWPFRVAGSIDIAAIAADRDQLWAEAVALYRQGTQWWLPPQIEDIAAEQQAAFVETDIWEDLIAAWLASHPGPFTMEHLFAWETGITPYREASAVDKRDQMRAAHCLTKLGLTKRQQRIGGRKAIWWQQP